MLRRLIATKSLKGFKKFQINAHPKRQTKRHPKGKMNGLGGSSKKLTLSLSNAYSSDKKYLYHSYVGIVTLNYSLTSDQKLNVKTYNNLN